MGGGPMKNTAGALHLLILYLCAILPFSSALNVGVQSSVSVSTACSRVCESQHCALPPLLRYGKYCGILYSGCPGEQPCDDLDACCMVHDACIQAKNHDYLNVECNEGLLNCVTRFRRSGKPTFKGNTCPVDEVVDVIALVMEAAILAGRIAHRP